MFYQVKILDGKGNLKKIISSNKLSKLYWKAFSEDINGESKLKSQSVVAKQEHKKKNKLKLYFENGCSAN